MSSSFLCRMNRAAGEIHTVSSLDDACMGYIIDIAFFLSGTPSIFNETDLLPQDDTSSASYKIVVTCSSFFIPIIAGSNVLVFCGIVLYPGFYNSNNVLLLSLSFADFLVGIYCLPLFLFSYMESTRDAIFANENACIAHLTCSIVSSNGSLHSLLFIACDRYLAILFPLQYQRYITVEKTIKALMLHWIFLLLLSIFPFSTNSYNPAVKNLQVRCNFYTVLPKFYIYFVVMGSAPCLLLSIILYSQIIYVVWKQARTLSLKDASETETQRFNNKLKTIKMTSFLMLMYVILWTPYIVVSPVKYYNLLSPGELDLFQCYAMLLTFANSLVNAPIYAMFRVDYREVYRMMLITAPWKWKENLRDLYRTKHGYGYFRDPDEPSTDSEKRAKLKTDSSGGKSMTNSTMTLDSYNWVRVLGKTEEKSSSPPPPTSSVPQAEPTVRPKMFYFDFSSTASSGRDNSITTTTF